MEMTLGHHLATTRSGDDDKGLLAAALAGEGAAMVQVVRKYERRVFGLAARMLRNTEDAEDVTQEVFLRLLTNLRRFRGDVRLPTWLYRTTYNLCVDLGRKRRPEMLSDAEGEAESVPAADRLEDPWERVKTEVERSAVNVALQQLPESYRAVLILHYFESLSYKEIGTVTGLSPKKVKARLFCARQRMRELLREEDVL
jgi:RNA polymerase sigma-70 factor (ECF subfamily)